MTNHLFSTYQLGNIHLKNRLVMSPMTRSRAVGNIPNVLMAKYYAQRATAGLIITEGVAPSKNGLGYTNIPGIFNEEEPCLLHGDLWSGNFMCNRDAEPVLVDPAVYFGHRSMDLGMTTLFGGFSSEFYEAYHYHYPFPANYKEQWEICNLYPLLIHLLLFGQSYFPSIDKVLTRYR